MPTTAAPRPAGGRYVAPYQRLYVNIDHVATLRQARRGDEPDPVEASRICEDVARAPLAASRRVAT
jgi:pyridoxine 5-phosphate synthase